MTVLSCCVVYCTELYYQLQSSEKLDLYTQVGIAKFVIFFFFWGLFPECSGYSKPLTSTSYIVIIKEKKKNEKEENPLSLLP